MFKKPSSPLTAVLQALFVTFLWSTSWVIIKFGLKDMPALTFAGWRYSLAFLCLSPFAFQPSARSSFRSLSRRNWLTLGLLGLLIYTFTQGAQFLGLALLPAVTVSLLLNFTTIVVTLLGIVLLAEQPSRLQWSGVALSVVGVLVYFYPASLLNNQVTGLIVMIVGVLTNALSAIMGRRINQEGMIHPLTVTLVSMGIGGPTLLVAGILSQGLPRLSPLNWLYLVWLAVVNTAFAFTLWNHTLRTLSAMESSIVNSTMPIQIALLAWLFLGEQVTWREGIGLVLAGAGVLMVQVRVRVGS